MHVPHSSEDRLSDCEDAPVGLTEVVKNWVCRDREVSGTFWAAGTIIHVYPTQLKQRAEEGKGARWTSQVLEH